MKLFLDSAIVNEVIEAVSWGVIQGVTTNPSLIASSGQELDSTIAQIAEIVRGPVSAEVISQELGGMLDEGRRLAQISPHVVIKVPMSRQGLQATRILRDEGIRTNVTLVFTPAQALLAANAGAAYVSPFIGRLEDRGEDGISVVETIARLLEAESLETEIIAASIRNPLQVVHAGLAGAHIATIPFKVFEAMLAHPLTHEGIEKFVQDWRKR